MTQADRLLELLYDRGEDHFALGELGGTMGLDRAKLQDALEVLRGRGHALELDPAYGVRLTRPFKLDAHLIERDLQTQRIGRSVICFDEVDSTNDVALDSAAQEGSDGLVVLADSQRRGRGRMGRTWISPHRANILMSVLLIDAGCELAHEALTIAAGLSVAEGIELACGVEPTLKWPNDVLLDDEKVAGVLIELRSISEKRAFAVGIGINVNAFPARDGVDFPATSLADHVHASVRRTEVVRAVLRRLDRWTEQIAENRLEELHADWVSRCGMLNQRIAVECDSRRCVGRVVDVSPLDGLILSCDDGRTIHLPSQRSTILPE